MISKKVHFTYIASNPDSPNPGLVSAEGVHQIGHLPSRVRVRANDGDRCVAPGKSKPKRRPTIRADHAIGLESSPDWMKWTEESYDVPTIIQMYDGKFPIIVKVSDAEGLQSEESSLVKHEQKFLVRSWGKQRRVIAQLLDVKPAANDHSTITEDYDDAGSLLSLPTDYQMYVRVVDNTDSTTSPNEIQEIRSFSKVVEIGKFPVVVQIVNILETDNDSSIIQKHNRIRVIGLQNTTCLQSSAIVDGWIEQSKEVAIADYLGIELFVAIGLLFSTDQEWIDYKSMLMRSVRHLPTNNSSYGDHGIRKIIRSISEVLDDDSLLSNSSDYCNSNRSDSSIVNRDISTFVNVEQVELMDSIFDERQEKTVQVVVSRDSLKISDGDNLHRRHQQRRIVYENHTNYENIGPSFDLPGNSSCQTEGNADRVSVIQVTPTIFNLTTSGTLMPNSSSRQQETVVGGLEVGRRLTDSVSDNGAKMPSKSSDIVTGAGVVMDVDENPPLLSTIVILDATSAVTSIVYKAGNRTNHVKPEINVASTVDSFKKDLVGPSLIGVEAALTEHTSPELPTKSSNGSQLHRISEADPPRPSLTETDETRTKSSIESAKLLFQPKPPSLKEQKSQEEYFLNPNRSKSSVCNGPPVRPKPAKTGAVTEAVGTTAHDTDVVNASELSGQLVNDDVIDVTTLSVAQLGHCAAELLHVEQRQIDLMSAAGFDGRQLASSTVEELARRFQMTPFVATKLVRYARGWRPTCT